MPHERVELKVPSGELAPILGLPFDEADAKHIGVDDKRLGWAEVRNASRREGDSEDRIRNLPSRLDGESMVTSRYPFMFGVCDDGLAVDCELVTGSVELDSS